MCRGATKKIVFLNCGSVPFFSLVRDVLEVVACYLRNVHGPGLTHVPFLLKMSIHFIQVYHS